MIRTTLLVGILAWLAIGATSVGPALAEPDRKTAAQVVDEAKMAAGSIPAQARTLTMLAWPDEPGDPEVSAIARQNLVGFGQHGMAELRKAVYRVDKRYTADLVSALIEARRGSMAGVPADYYPALEDALWEGSEDAKRLAIEELARVQYPPVVLACIDAAVEHPGLTKLVIRSLGRFRDYRARFYLAEILNTGDPALSPLAAESLAAIGGTALEPLRDGALHDGISVRRPAMTALLPTSTFDDLSVMYEYLRRFEDDPPELLEAVRARSVLLESLLQQQMDLDSASPSLD